MANKCCAVMKPMQRSPCRCDRECEMGRTVLYVGAQLQRAKQNRGGCVRYGAKEFYGVCDLGLDLVSDFIISLLKTILPLSLLYF